MCRYATLPNRGTYEDGLEGASDLDSQVSQARADGPSRPLSSNGTETWDKGQHFFKNTLLQQQTETSVTGEACKEPAQRGEAQCSSADCLSICDPEQIGFSHSSGTPTGAQCRRGGLFCGA